jgi:hypothetical protein
MGVIITSFIPALSFAPPQDVFQDPLTDTVAAIRNRFSIIWGANNLIAQASGLRFTTQTTDLIGGSISAGGWIPRKAGGILDKEQFAEIVYAGESGTEGRCGLILCADFDGRAVCEPAVAQSGSSQAYIFSILPGVSGLIRRLNNGVKTTIGAAFPAVVVGTKVAVTVTFEAGQSVLEVFYNEVSQGTRTDVGPNVSQGGMPGILVLEGIAAGSTQTFTNFRCGVKSKLGY